MSIAGAYRLAVHRSHRVERRSRRRTVRATVLRLVAFAGWCLAFVALGWLVAAGFYDLLANA